MHALDALRARMVAAHSSWRTADGVLLLLRVALGATFVAHGGQKLFDWINVDPHGIDGTTKFFDFVGIPIPGFFAWVVGLTEFIGGLLLIAGALTSIVAIALAIDMFVAIVTYNAANGFFTETQDGGWELNLIILLVMVTLALLGPGRYSVDASIGLTRSGERLDGRRRFDRAAASAPREPAGLS
jgi:putative oxidoreductase